MQHTITAGIILLGLGLGGSAALAAPEPLSGEEIQAKVRENYGTISTCYRSHAAQQKKASGMVKVSWIVEKDGDIGKVSVDAPGVRGPAFMKCVTDEVATWRFRELPGATEVEVPFTFQKTYAPGAGPTRR